MMSVNDVDTQLLKEEVTKLNENPVLETCGIKKIRTVGIKKVDMVDLFIDAITIIGEEDKEDELEDSTIEFYNFIVDDYPESEEEEQEEEAVPETPFSTLSNNPEKIEKINEDYEEWTTQEILALSDSELLDLIEENDLDVNTDVDQDISDIRTAVLEELELFTEEPEEDEPEEEEKPVLRKEPEPEPEDFKDKKEKSLFGHMLSKQTGKMDVMLVDGASFTEIMDKLGNERKDIIRHLRRLRKKGFKILQKEADDPDDTVYRVVIK